MAILSGVGSVLAIAASVGLAGKLSDELARLEQVRADIEREYSSRGPATMTPPVTVN